MKLIHLIGLSLALACGSDSGDVAVPENAELEWRKDGEYRSVIGSPTLSLGVARFRVEGTGLRSLSKLTTPGRLAILAQPECLVADSSQAMHDLATGRRRIPISRLTDEGAGLPLEDRVLILRGSNGQLLGCGPIRFVRDEE
jgi:hypothetical protein